MIGSTGGCGRKGLGQRGWLGVIEAVQGRDDEGLGQEPGEVNLAPLHLLDLLEVAESEVPLLYSRW